MSKEYNIKTSSENAVEEMRDLLDSLPIQLEDVTEIEIQLVAEKRSIPDSQSTLDDITLTAEMVNSNVEYGPVPDFERGEPSHYKGGGGNHYEGSTKKDAVMPDTKHSEILRAVDSSWKTPRDVAEELDMKPNATSAYLSADFYDYGYVKRREDSVPYEYTLDVNGREALRLGYKSYKESLESEEELDDKVSIDIDR